MNNLVLIIYCVILNVFTTCATEVDSLIYLLEKENNKSQIAFIEFEIGTYFSKRGEYRESLKYLFDAYGYYRASNNIEKANCAHELARTYYHLSSFNKSLIFAYEALKYFESNPKGDQPVKVLNVIGYNLNSTKNYDEAIDYLNRALRISVETKNKKQEIKTLLSLSSVYFNQEKYDKSFNYDHDAISIAIALKDSITLTASYNNLATNYFVRGNLDSTLIFLNLALKVAQDINEIQRESSILGNIGDLYFMENKAEIAHPYYMRSIDLARQSGSKKTILANYKRLVDYYDANHNYKTANTYYKKYLALNDSIKSEFALLRINNMNAIYESFEKEKELELSDEKVKVLNVKLDLKKKEKWWLVICIVGLLILVFLIALRYYQKNKINKQQDVINNQKTRIQESEFEKQNILNQNLASIIEHKKEQLALKTINVFHKTEAFNELKELIFDLGNEFDTEPKSFVKIKRLISQKNNLDSEWKKFENMFNEVHPSFFSELIRKHRALTKKDIRHSAYIKLQLSTKEIANLFGISPASVQMARVRLKKKMDIPKDQSIHEYIRNL